MPEKADDPLDRLFHPEEVRELGIDLDRAIHKDAAETPVLARIDHRRLADGGPRKITSDRECRTAIAGSKISAMFFVAQRSLSCKPVERLG
jgi:hypothetical protein